MDNTITELGVQSRTVQLYKFSELSEDGKRQAIEEQRQRIIEDPWTLNEDISCAINFTWDQMVGSEVALHNGDIDVEFSLGHCQGDGVTFYGILYKERAPLLPWPKDVDGVRLLRTSLSNHYTHYNTFNVEAFDEHGDSVETNIDELDEALRVLSRRCERNGYQAMDDTLSDENITDYLIEADADLGYRYLTAGRTAPSYLWQSGIAQQHLA